MQLSNSSVRIDSGELSSTQRRLRALRRRHDADIHSLVRCEIHENIDIDRLRSALRTVMNRHEILLTRYPAESGAPWISKACTPDREPAHEVLSSWPEGTNRPADDAESVYSALRNEAHSSDTEPCAKFILVKSADDRFHLLGRVPGMNADRRSIHRLIEEWNSAYRDSPETSGDDLPPQFRDVAAWMDSSVDDSVRSSALAFWRSHLKNVPWRMDLPLESLPASGPAVFDIATIGWELPEWVAEETFRARGGENRLKARLTATVAVWLARVTGKQSVFAGVSFHGRVYEELNSVIGPYEKYLPVIANIDKTTTLEGLMDLLGGQMEELGAWQEWFSLDDDADGPLSPDGRATYPICVDVYTCDDSSLRESGPLRLTGLTGAADTYAIRLTCEIGRTRIRAEVNYNSAIYEAPVILRLQQQINALLSALRDRRLDRVVDVDFLSAEERACLIGPPTAERPSAGEAVHVLFERQAELSPDAVAVVQGDLHLSYRCLNVISNRLARKLLLRAAGPDVLIAFRMRTSWEVHLAILAILKTGSAYVPVDPDWPRERADAVLREAGVATVLTCGSEDLKEKGLSQISCDGAALWDDVSLPRSNPGIQAAPDNLSYVLFTSGTSGTPKGVMVTHRGFSNYITWCASYYEIRSSRGAAVHSPITFDFTLTCLVAPLTVGRTVYVCTSTSPLEGLAEALSMLDEIGIIKLTPTSVDPLMHLLKERGSACKVRYVVIGGEALWGTRPLWDLQERFGASIINEYGPTESVVGSGVYRIGPYERKEGPIPIGRAIAHTGLRLLKANGSPAETWTEAEVNIGGFGLARGYLNHPGLTAAVFTPDPDSVPPGERLYRTGDVARYLTSGDILYLGRRDSQVKIRGHRIELAEVEAAIRRHPSVAACVLSVEEKTDSHSRMIAFLAPAANADLNIAEMRRHVAAILPEYMVPAVFHVVAEIPATANGKADLDALQRDLVSQAERKVQVAPPRSEVEKMLHRLWCEVLERDTIGIDDNFFELGGDSILVIQFLARANEAGLRLRPRDMRDRPTISGLSELAESTIATASPANEKPEGEVPLAPIQRLFFEWNLQEPRHYNQSVLLSVPDRRTPAHFRKAFEGIIEHHDSLRLYFEKDEAGYRQFYAKSFDPDFISLLDCSSLSEAESRHRLELLSKESQQSIKLNRAPLLRVILCSASRERSELLLYIVVHHLVVDHVSWTILLADLRLALEQAAADKPVVLPRKTASYRDWVDHLRTRARGDLEKEKKYWLSERWKAVPKLLVDFPNAPRENRVEDEQTVSVMLPPQETRALLHQAMAAYNTRVIDLLLTAWCVAFFRRNGARTLTVNLEGHGRNSIEGLPDSQTIGWFTSIFPVYLTLTSPGDIRRSIQDMKEALRAVPEDGSTYGLMRYLTGDDHIGAACAELHDTGVAFNYLGEIEHAVAKDSPFQWVRSSPAKNRSGKNARPFLLEIGAYISQGELRVNFTYGRNIHRQESVAGLAHDFLDTLKGLVAHCCEREQRGYTPSDFPLAHLTQDALDGIAAAHPDLEDIYPLSPTQSGILFHALQNVDAASYLVQLCITLAGKLNTRAFEESWRNVIWRHTALRTSFLWESLVEPIQIVHRTTDIPFLTEDWRGGGEDHLRLRLNEWLQSRRERNMDLTKAPLHSFALFRIAEERYCFVWTYHHILVDGWSTSNILREVLAGYLQLTGDSVSQERPARRYREYIEWLQSKSREETSLYWKRKMAGVTGGTVLRLPAPEVQAEKSGRIHEEELLSLAAGDSADLTEVAGRLQITANTIIQGAWALVLSRYAGTDDVIFGVTVSGRPYDLPGVEDRVGLFINTLPVRIRVDRALRLDAYLRGINADLQEMLEHDHTPLVEVQKICLLPDRERLFESILVFENYPMSFDFGSLRENLKVEEIRTAEQTNYPLTLVVGTLGAELSVKIVYDPAHFDRPSIRRILEYLMETLRWIAGSHEARLADWAGSVLSDGATDEYPAEPEGSAWMRPIQKIFEDQVIRCAHAVAVVDADQAVSYQTLNRRANQLAHCLVGAGAGPGTFVAICVERSANMIVALLAVLKAGAAYVPIDSRFPTGRIELLARDVPLAVTDAASRHHFASAAARVFDIETDGEVIFAGPSANPVTVFASVEQVAYLMYTSGSSGRPKGALISHRNVTRLFSSALKLYEFGADGVWSFFHSVAFDFSVWEIFGALLTGGRLVVTPYWVARSPDQFADLLRREGVTVLSQTPSAFQQLLTIGGLLENDAGLNLKWVVFGGEALHMKPLLSFCPDLDRLGIRLVNMYGITETTVHVTHRLMDDYTTLDNGSYIGRPLPDLRIYLLDQGLYRVPDMVAGEICVAGEGLAVGYMNSAPLTAQRFIPNPFSRMPGRRLYRSGDLGRSRGRSEIEYLGRGDRQVKIRGFRIELDEVRFHLLRQEAVRDAVVRAVEDQAGDRILAAYVVPATELSVADIRKTLREQLPEHMVPAAIRIVEKFPLTPNGKIDFAALPPVSRTNHRENRIFVPPQSWEQDLIADVWCDVLGMQQIDIREDFFTLGGDSIKALRVIGRLRSLGFDASITALFESPTITDFSHRLSSPAASAEVPIAELQEHAMPETGKLPAGAVDAYPVTQLQLGMLFHAAHVGTTFTPYHNVSMFRLRGQFDEAVFRRAAEKLFATHPALRTAFELEAFSIPMQIVYGAIDLPLTVSHIEGLSPEARQVFIEDLLEREKADHFKADVAPLIRFHIAVCGDGTFYFVLTEHHAILDGWSVAGMLTELFQDYLHGSDDGPAEARYSPEANVFRSYVILERQALASGSHEEFWRDYLRDYVPLQLPREPAEGRKTAGGPAVRKKRVTLDDELANGLKSFAQDAQVPLKSVLLSAHLAVLGFFANCPDTITGLITHGRPEVEGGEAGLGLFLNTLPLRVAQRNTSWKAWVKTVFGEEKRILPYRRYPLAAMRDQFGQKPELAAAFNYVNFHIYETLEQNAAISVLESYIHEETNFDLLTDFSLLSHTARLDLTISYNTSKLSEFQAETLCECYLHCLRRMASDFSAKTSEAFVDGMAADVPPLGDFRSAGTQVPEDLCSLLQVSMQPGLSHCIALVDQDRHVSYRELWRNVSAEAFQLRKLGVGADNPVAVLMNKSLEWVVAALAVIEAGGVYVPIEPNDPPERIRYILRDTGARLVLADENCAKLVSETEIEMLPVRCPVEPVARKKGHRRFSAVVPDQLAYIIYTSGSTGKPKGVSMHHRGIANLMTWQSVEMPIERRRILQYAPVGFDVSVQEILTGLTGGNTLVIVPSETRRDFVVLAGLMADQQIECLFAPYTVIKTLLLAARSCGIGLKALSRIINAGESLILDPDLADFIESNGQLFNHYGPTESHVVTACMVKGAESRPGIGRPIANSEMMILDQWLRPLPPGVVGEMYIASVNVARHYHNAPRLTAERFVPGRLRSPSGGDRLFRTGDLGYQDSDGNIFFVGRSNTQVKLKGYRIELDEVRYAFLQHPSVSDAVVALSGGDEEKSLIAWIVANEKPDPAELREYVGRTIPGYMVPSQVIPIEAVPLTKNGKVDYAALPRLASEVSTELTAKPEGMVATELFNIWKEVLKRKEIGMTHDFLQSGGDSILLLQLQLKIQSRFGIDVSLGRLAVNSSLEKMSRYLQDLLDQKSPSAIASGVPDPVANSARIGS